MKKSLLIISFLISFTAFSQQPTYPKPVGYFSVVHPLVTVDKDETVYNFSNVAYTVGFPFGINILTSNVLFHPEFMFRRPHGFAILTRATFETVGRYGATSVFNKVISKTKTNNFFIATPIPFRFGNDKPASIGINLQLGITF